MALACEIAFWACICLIAYNYVGYPVLLALMGSLGQIKSDISFLLTRRDRRQAEKRGASPSIAVIVSAFNEQSVIAARVKNLLEIDYPAERMEILIGLDASTDATPEILKRFRSPGLRVFHFPTRRGKLAVISDLARRTRAQFLVFTDANTMFEQNCIRNLIRHFADPEVGLVTGEEIRTIKPGTDPGAESLYWRYESVMKILESRANCLHSANGSVYAIRRNLFCPRPHFIVEDFQIPLELRFQGHRVVYDPEAIAVEEIAPSLASQFERRVRLGAGNFQTLFGNLNYLGPFNGLPGFAYWSHRVLRWITPFLLVLAFACCGYLLRNRFYLCLLLAQCAFYGLALLGEYLSRKRRRLPGIWQLPRHFCSMNMAMAFGFFRYLSGKQSLAWAVTPRAQAEETAA